MNTSLNRYKFMMYFKFIFAVIIGFIINPCFSKNIEAQYDVIIPDELLINIQGKSLKKYATFLTKISEDKTGLIHPNYKNSFNIFLTSKNRLDKSFTLKARARITGDYDDHINIREGISSLMIRLKKSNLGGITKFRLLLPVTRNGNSEIFWSVLMEYLGFPVPYRKIIHVYFNNDKKKIPMIFSERAEKEFLERFGFRETAIIEVDERQEFANRYWRLDPKRCLGDYIENKKACKFNDAPEHLPYKIENESFLKNPTSIEIFYRGIISLLEKEEKNQLNEYFRNLNIKYAKHGLGRINEKYIYNPIFHNKIPIYVDGMVEIPGCSKKIQTNKLPIYFQKSFKILEKVYELRSLGKTLTNDMKCVVVEVLNMQKKIEFKLKKINNQLNYNLINTKSTSFFKPILNRHNISTPIIHLSNNFKTAIYCDSIYKIKGKDCSMLRFSKLVDALAGNLPPKNYKEYELFPIISIPKPLKKNEMIQEIFLNRSTENLYVENNQIKFLKVNSFGSKINVYLSSQNSQVVFYNSQIKNSKISIFRPSKVFNNNNNIRYNYRLLTGCFTLISSIIENTHLYSEKSNCEDAINFIGVNGKNISSRIIDSSHDALDVDFSKITFSKIFIKNSGNDCVDFSFSTFNISNFNAINCNDKALSVGETSIGVVKKLNLKNSKIGFAVKDSSELNLLNPINKQNVKTCGMLYNKKQEFEGGVLKSYNSDNCDVLVDDFSFYNKNYSLICKFVSNNKYFNICVTKSKLILNKKEFFPKSAVINLTNLNEAYKDNANSINIKNCAQNSNLCSFKFTKKFSFKNGLGITISDPKNKKIIFFNNYIKP